MKYCFRFVLPLLVCMLAALQAAAQTVSSTTGAINGTVSDSSKAVMPGVTVSLSGTTVMGQPTAVTDATGSYRFPSLAPGDYALAFELSGFGIARREGIHVSLGFTATVNVEVAPG